MAPPPTYPQPKSWPSTGYPQVIHRFSTGNRGLCTGYPQPLSCPQGYAQGRGCPQAKLSTPLSTGQTPLFARVSNRGPESYPQAPDIPTLSTGNPQADLWITPGLTGANPSGHPSPPSGQAGAQGRQGRFAVRSAGRSQHCSNAALQQRRGGPPSNGARRLGAVTAIPFRHPLRYHFVTSHCT